MIFIRYTPYFRLRVNNLNRKNKTVVRYNRKIKTHSLYVTADAYFGYKGEIYA